MYVLNREIILDSMYVVSGTAQNVGEPLPEAPPRKMYCAHRYSTIQASSEPVVRANSAASEPDALGDRNAEAVSVSG